VSLTNLSVVLLTGIAGHLGRDVAIGYAMGARLEYILIPLAFGCGTAIVAMVGTNWSARQSDRAYAIACMGAATVAVACGTIGFIVALHPGLWMGLLTCDEDISRARCRRRWILWRHRRRILHLRGSDSSRGAQSQGLLDESNEIESGNEENQSMYQSFISVILGAIAGLANAAKAPGQGSCGPTLAVKGGPAVFALMGAPATLVPRLSKARSPIGCLAR
jgi:hypothetical protein